MHPVTSKTMTQTVAELRDSQALNSQAISGIKPNQTQCKDYIV